MSVTGPASPSDGNIDDDSVIGRITNSELYRLLLRVDRRIDQLNVVTKDQYVADQAAVVLRIVDTRTYCEGQIATLTVKMDGEARAWRDSRASVQRRVATMVPVISTVAGIGTYLVLHVLHLA